MPSRDFAGDKIPSRAVDAYQEHEGVDVAIEIAKNREQEADMVMQTGPNLGLSPYSRNDPLSYLGLTPLKNNEEGSKWQVNSHGSWSQRKQRLGAIQPIAN